MVGFVACYQVFEGAMSGKSRIESACSLSWFANWKPEQKVEFAKVLVRLENPQSAVASACSDADVDDLMTSLGQMSVNQRECPGVFECQLKIFEKWYTKWAREDQLVFVDALKKNDPEFQTVLGYI